LCCLFTIKQMNDDAMLVLQKEENGTKKRKLHMLNGEVSIRKVKVKNNLTKVKGKKNEVKVKKTVQTDVTPDVIELSSDSEPVPDTDPLLIDASQIKCDPNIDFGLNLQNIVIIPVGTPGLGGTAPRKTKDCATPGVRGTAPSKPDHIVATPSVRGTAPSNPDHIVATPGVRGTAPRKTKDCATPGVRGTAPSKTKDCATPGVRGTAPSKTKDCATPGVRGTALSKTKDCATFDVRGTAPSNPDHIVATPGVRGTAPSKTKNCATPGVRGTAPSKTKDCATPGVRVTAPFKTKKFKARRLVDYSESDDSSNENPPTPCISKELDPLGCSPPMPCISKELVLIMPCIDKDVLNSEHTDSCNGSTSSKVLTIMSDRLTHCKPLPSRTECDSLESESTQCSLHELADNAVHTPHIAKATEDQDSSVDPLASQDSSVDPLASQDSSVDPLASQDSSVVPLASQDSSVVPLASQDSSMVPLASQDSSIIPLASQDSSVDPLASQDSSVDPLASQDSSVDPLAAQDSSVVPLASQDSSVDPLASQDSSMVPLASQDSCDEMQSLKYCDSVTSEGTLYSPHSQDSNPESSQENCMGPESIDSVACTDEELARKFECTPCSILLDQQEVSVLVFYLAN
jgi:hypothetical protein